MGEERNLAGYPVVHVPPAIMHPNANAAQVAIRNSMKALVQQIKRDKNEGVVFPAEKDQNGQDTGYKLSLMSAGGRNRGSINEAIKDHRSEMMIALLAAFLLLGQAQVGSFALSSDQTKLFTVAIGYIMDCVVDVFNNDIIPHLMRLNNVPRRYWPEMSHGDVEKQEVDKTLAAFTGLVTAGAIVPTEADEKHIRELIDFPPRGPDDTPMQINEEGEDDLGLELGFDQPMLPAPPVMPVAPAPPPIPEPPKEPDSAMTVDEAAAKINVKRSTLMRLINRGLIPGAKFGNSFRIMPEDLNEFMRMRPKEQTPPVAPAIPPQPQGASQWTMPPVMR